MKLIVLSITVLIIVYLLSQEVEFIETITAENPDSLCLDGSPYKFFFHNGNVNKLIIFFEGGAWCGIKTPNTTLLNCVDRSKMRLGNSNYIFSKFPIISRFSDILSSNRYYNPEFYNWNKAIIRYCDGAGHIGHADHEINGTKLYFRGYLNTMSVLNYLKKNNYLNADEVIISGISAGGNAALYWANYISLSLNENTKVRIIPFAGIFFDVFNKYRKEYVFRETWKELVRLTKPEKNIDFMESYCNEEEIWKCFIAEYFVNKVKHPILIVNSILDSYAINTLLDEKCIINPNLIDNCIDKSKINEYREKSLIFFNEIYKDKNISLWLSHCAFHVMSFFSNIYNDESIGMNGLSLHESIRNWMNNNYTSIIKDTKWEENNCNYIKDIYYYIQYYKLENI